LRPGLARRLARFERAVKRLGEVASLSLEDYMKSADSQVIAERELEVAIEALLDVSNSVISAMSWRTPASYRDVAAVLYENSVVTMEEAEELGELAGLRNILVRLYADVDHASLHVNLPRYVGSLRCVMAKVLKFIEERGIDPPLP